MTRTRSPSGVPARLLWIDWLKVVAALGVLAYHAAQPFVVTGWVVTSGETSLVLSGLAGLGYLIWMPLMFLLAGAAGWLALRSRSVGPYLSVRVQRLATPLLLGIALFSPLQGWVGASTRGPVEPLPSFALHFFANMEFYPTPVWLGDYGYHLWFLGFLLAYVFISLPLLVWMRAERSQTLIDRAAPFLVSPLGLAWPLVPLIGSQFLLRLTFPAYRDWADFTLWLLYFVLGALVVASPHLLKAIAVRGLRLLVPALILAAAFIPIAASGALWRFEVAERFDAAWLGYVALRTSVGWCWVLVALAIAVRWLNRGPRLAGPANQLVLPFYVLHHPIVVIAAAAIVGWPVGLSLKYLAIVVTSLVVTVAASLAIARIPILRGALGLPGSRLDASPSGAAV
jgi:hypothetical protein